MGIKTIPEVQKDASTLPYAGAQHHCASCGRALQRRGDRCRVCLPSDRGAQPLSRVASSDRERFRIVSLLAEGTKSAVYQARDELLQRDVALKRLAPEHAGQEQVEALHREARALARVRHGNVARLYHFGDDGRSCSLVMELVAGQTLEEMLRTRAQSNRPLPVALALDIMAGILDGVAAVHGQGIVHGHLTVANVIIEEHSSRPVLIDFGHATLRTERRPYAGGTPGYTAPELSQPDAIANELTDIYALGFILVQLLACSELAFEATLRQVSPPSKRLPRSRFEVFDAIVGKARAAQPELRFAGVAAMKEALLRVKKRWSSDEWNLLKHSVTRKASSIRVLIAAPDEGSRHARQAVRIAFFEKRVSIACETQGQAAVTAAHEHLPQLLLLDARLQDDDALRTLAHIRLLPGGCEVCVALLGAEPMGARERTRWEGLGVRHMLAQPLRLEMLVDEISAIARDAGWLTEDEPMEGNEPSPPPLLRLVPGS